jgi:adenosylhomocysteine nucleosidase
VLAIVGAFREEIAGIRSFLQIKRTFRAGRIVAYEGLSGDRKIVLARGGVGKQGAEAAAELVLHRYPTRLILSVGFAGALTEKLAIGDVVVCSLFHCWSGQPLDDLLPEDGCHCSADVAAPAFRATRTEASRLVSGVTANRVVIDAETKRALHTAYGAEVVDMESYWICRIASRLNVPFLSIRSISDTPREPLPSFIADANDGSIRSLSKALIALLSHPRHLPTLYRNLRVAEARLTDCVRRLICQW